MNKILKADAYASALRMRVCAQTDTFVLHFCAYRANFYLTQPCPQLGLVVPKRLAKRAVARNTVKRLTREYFRLNQHGLANGLWVLRLKKNINQQILSPAQKKLWASELVRLFEQGQKFAAQYVPK